MELDQDLEHEQRHQPSSAAQGVCAALIADAPWKAKSVMTAGTAMAAGLVSWIGDYTSPAMAQLGGSYIGGFFLGWAFRRFLKMAAIAVGFVLAGVAVLKSTGWVELDWVAVEKQITDGLAALHHGAEGLKELLAGYLPSAGAAGAGTFFGFRKK